MRSGITNAMTQSDKFIFLDIDGVLNNRRTHTVKPYDVPGISKCNLDVLKEIAERTGTRPVLISDWRLSFDSRDHKQAMAGYITKKLLSIGLTLDLVSTEYRYSDRTLDIKHWIESHPTSGYVILDDMNFDGYCDPAVYPHWIRPDSKKGLVPAHADEAVRIMDGPVTHITYRERSIL